MRPRARPIRRLLIANRGEIALRVVRAAHSLGIRSVVAHSDVDADGAAARLADEAIPIDPGGPPRCYLDIGKVVAAAKKSRCDAVHPGYGFLSENAAFAEAVTGAGLSFIGPSPETMRLTGDKLSARRTAFQAGVAVVPGSEKAVSARELPAVARKIGYPLMLKAAGGGGGKGIRMVSSARALASSFERATEEARSAFADPAVYVERRLHPARHVEVQILADLSGRVVSLPERECSIQRRHQKLIEESPSAACGPALRRRLCRAAVRIARACRYTGAGTVEFLLDGRGRFFFLEVNARIQVEHPVTEMVTGLDLVAAQLRIADGEPLAVERQDVGPRGHAIEARVLAEDPFAGFAPCTGTVSRLHLPGGPGLRVDTALAAGSVVTPHYDSLLAKVIGWAPTRRGAARRLSDALEEIDIGNVPTTAVFLAELVRSEPFLSGRLSTDFLERWKPARPAPRVLAAAALAAVLARGRPRQAPAPQASESRPDGWAIAGRREGISHGIPRPDLWKNV